jgi:hypothetical protein
MSVETSALQSHVERLQSWRHFPITFAIDRLLNFGELDDAAALVNLRSDEADTAKDRPLSEALSQKFDVAHTIEDREDHRLWSHSRREIVSGRLQRVGFHAQEDQVKRPIDFPGADQFRREEQVAMRTDDTQPVAAELRGSGRADEKGHIAASLGEPGAKVTADRTGADNEDSHCYMEASYSGLPMT